MNVTFVLAGDVSESLRPYRDMLQALADVKGVGQVCHAALFVGSRCLPVANDFRFVLRVGRSLDTHTPSLLHHNMFA